MKKRTHHVTSKKEVSTRQSNQSGNDFVPVQIDRTLTHKIPIQPRSIQHLTKSPKLKDYEVGKIVYGSRYVHKKYRKQLDNQKQLKKSTKLMRSKYPRHKYDIIKHDTIDGSFSFISSPDFDTAKNPKISDVVVVNTDGSVRKIREKENPEIYHLKYLFVDYDYDGFDVKKVEIEHYRSVVKSRKLTRREHERLKVIASLNSDKTRITNPNPTDSARYIGKEYPRKSVILDHGAGKGRSTRFLRKKGFKVYSYDPYESNTRSVNDSYDKRVRYDVVLSDYVINTLAPKQRKEYIDELSNVNTDKIIITVRSEKQIASQRDSNPKNYLPLEEGGYFVISSGTYQKGFSTSEVKNMEKQLDMKSKKISSTNDKIIYEFTRKQN